MKKCLWLLLFVGMELYAQPFSELRVGDKFPDYELKNMLNYPTETLKLSDFRGKLVILDMWGTTCGACVNAWPKMLSLQKEFAGKIQIILVDKYETKEFVKDYVETRRKITDVNMNLPMACRDTTLRQLFPNNGVPRYYWIDRDGTVQSITQEPVVNSKNIAAWLTSGPPKMPQVHTIIRPNWNEPLFVDGNGGEGNADRFVWSSILTKGVKTMPFAIGVSAGRRGNYRLSTTAANIRRLYQVAYHKGNLDSTYFTSMVPHNLVRVFAKDTTRFYEISNDTIVLDNLYNYQLMAGVRVPREEMFKMMRQDLMRYFNLDVTWEKVVKKCLVWTIEDKSKVVYKGGERDMYLNDVEVIFDGVTVFESIRFMQDASSYYNSPYPLIDETNFNEKLGLRFNCKCTDWRSLSEAFRKHGMNLKLEDREVEVLTLRER